MCFIKECHICIRISNPDITDEKDNVYCSNECRLKIFRKTYRMCF